MSNYGLSHELQLPLSIKPKDWPAYETESRSLYGLRRSVQNGNLTVCQLILTLAIESPGTRQDELLEMNLNHIHFGLLSFFIPVYSYRTILTCQRRVSALAKTWL